MFDLLMFMCLVTQVMMVQSDWPDLHYQNLLCLFFFENKNLLCQGMYIHT